MGETIWEVSATELAESTINTSGHRKITANRRGVAAVATVESYVGIARTSASRSPTIVAHLERPCKREQRPQIAEKRS